MTEQTVVMQVEAGKPHSAHQEIAKVFQSLSGEVCICDPYYGKGSLLRLSALSHVSSVKFLTQNPDGKEKSFISRAIQEFVKEHSNVELREYAGNDIHDRYLVTADEFILLGHGLKDIGNKESFVIKLDRSIAGDAIDTLQQSFNQKWVVANYFTKVKKGSELFMK
jgi:hypothetical protein